MTEGEWLGCTDPRSMLEFLNGEASDRKHRLIACACARRVWERISSTTPAEIELSEAFADGQASAKEIVERWELLIVPKEPRSAWAACAALQWLLNDTDSTSEVAENLIEFAVEFRTLLDGEQHCYNAVYPETDAQRATRNAIFDAETIEQVALIRDIVGNPFCPVSLDSVWLTPTVLSLAESVYNERSLPTGNFEPERLAVLADALEDAGCADADILSHCRGPGPHVRGCWVVDLLLGKQ
jgi:hypothetical protein